MKQQIILLSANPYSIRDEQSGRVNEGVSITYLPDGSLEPVDNHPAKGVKAAKGSLPVSQDQNIVLVPGYYDAELMFAVDRDGRPALKVLNVQFLGAIDAKLAVSKAAK